MSARSGKTGIVTATVRSLQTIEVAPEHSLVPGRSGAKVTLKSLRKCLIQAPTHAFAPQSKTLFSLGGRGYYENPTSDLLAFFLHPRKAHGLGSLFLRALFECMGLDDGLLKPLGGINVTREERLDDGKRKDLLVRGAGWVLAIENKIRHKPDNDFAAYAAHARRVAGRNGKVHLALLAPEQIEVGRGWKPISYRDLCAAMQRAFDEIFPTLPPSKWQVFAREFVTHLQTELYPLVTMKLDPQQIAFVEKHLPEIDVVEKLSKAYPEFLRTELKERLGRAMPGFDFNFDLEDHVLACNEPGPNNWCFTFQSPLQRENSSSASKFVIAVWLRHGRGGQKYRVRGDTLLATMERGESADGGDWWERSYEHRPEAVEALCELARSLFVSA